MEINRAVKFDLLVATMKNKRGDEKRTSPQLLDEALDYLFDKYMNPEGQG